MQQSRPDKRCTLIIISSIDYGKFDYQPYHSLPLEINGYGNTLVDQVLFLFESNACEGIASSCTCLKLELELSATISALKLFYVTISVPVSLLFSFAKVSSFVSSLVMVLLLIFDGIDSSLSDSGAILKETVDS